MKEIVVLHSDHVRAEIQRRGPGGWTIEDFVGKDGTICLESIGASVRLIEIYEGIDLGEV